jgi:hypothetical protein
VVDLLVGEGAEGRAAGAAETVPGSWALTLSHTAAASWERNLSHCSTELWYSS